MENYFKHKMRSKNLFAIVGMVLLIIIGITALITLCGFVTMKLWNWLVPELFGLASITFWQAIGLLILFKILFGGIGSSSSKKDKKHKNYCKDDKPKKDFSKWQLYDKYWKEEGEVAFNAYVDRSNGNEVEPENSNEK